MQVQLDNCCVCIRSHKDWFFISRKQLCLAGGSGIYAHYKTFSKLLQTAYPEHNWHPHTFVKYRYSKTQRTLFQHVKSVSNGRNTT